MIATCVNHALKFRYVLMDKLVCDGGKLRVYCEKAQTLSIATLKDNRLVALYGSIPWH